MNTKFCTSAFSFLTAATVFLSSPALFGATKVEIVDRPKYDDLLSPEFSGVKSKQYKAKDWLEVEVRIRVEMAPEPKNKTCDKLTVKWYIAVENPDKAETFLKLTKEVEYVNVPLKEEVYCSVYLSPASIRRLTGFERSGKRAVKLVGVEVIVDGQTLADATDKAGKDKWWSVPSNRIVESTTVPLLNKTETPFASVWWDRYAEVKAKN